MDRERDKKQDKTYRQRGEGEEATHASCLCCLPTLPLSHSLSVSKLMVALSDLKKKVSCGGKMREESLRCALQTNPLNVLPISGNMCTLCVCVCVCGYIYIDKKTSKSQVNML